MPQDWHSSFLAYGTPVNKIIVSLVGVFFVVVTRSSTKRSGIIPIRILPKEKHFSRVLTISVLTAFVDTLLLIDSTLPGPCPFFGLWQPRRMQSQASNNLLGFHDEMSLIVVNINYLSWEELSAIWKIYRKFHNRLRFRILVPKRENMKMRLNLI